MGEERIETIENRRVMFGNGERDYSVDMMRSLSCLMVVAVHTASMTLTKIDATPDVDNTALWTDTIMLKCATVSATNLFLMISGIFFLSPERNVTISKVWSKNVLKLAVAYVLWSILYALLRIYYYDPRPYTPDLLFQEALIQETHLWYIPMMLGIYVLVPLMRVFTAHATRKEYLYMIGLLIGAMTLNTVVTICGYYENETSANIITIISRTPTAALCQYPFYCILGYYLYTYPPKVKTRVVIYILGLAGLAFCFYTAGILHDDVGINNPIEFLGKFTIGILAKNTALFILVITLFSKVRMGKAFKIVLSKISAATLFVYLYHMVPLRIIFKEQWLFVDGFPTFKNLFLYIFLIYAAGIIISFLFLQLIPWVKMRNVILDLVWPNRKLWVTRKKK